MPDLNALKDIRLDVCREFIEKEFKGTIQLTRGKDDVYLTACFVAPAEGEGGCVIAYNSEENEWFELDDWDAFVNITHDGKVFFAYPLEDPEDGYGMYFKIGHPREAAELLHLLVHPKTCTAPLPEGEEPWRMHRLGELFEIKVLIPCGKTWKTLDPLALPAGEPDDFRRLLLVNVVRHWDSFTLGDAIQSSKFAERWPEYIGGLPDATPDLRVGYLMDFEGNLRSAVDSLVNEPDPENLFLDLLLVPRKADVSCLYLRELLAGDHSTREALKEAPHLPETLELLCARFSGIEVSLPSRYHHQIRQVAEHIDVREILSRSAKAIAARPGDFRTVVERNRQCAIAMRQVEVHPDWVLTAVPRDPRSDSAPL